MANNILITGYPGVGKTTLIKKVIANLNRNIGGFYTHERRINGKRTGFYISDFCGNKMVMADVNFRTGYRVGKYGVNLEAFEIIGIKALKKAKKNSDLVVVDEIGTMELFSEKFCHILLDIFAADKPLLATIKKRDNEFLHKLKKRKDVTLFELTINNRDKIRKLVEQNF